METAKMKLVDCSYKLTDFYYSFDYNKFGWITCPYMGSKPIAQATARPIVAGIVDCHEACLLAFFDPNCLQT